MADLRAKVSQEFKNEFLARAESEGLSQTEAVSQALEKWVKESPSQKPNLEGEIQEYFSNVNGDKRERLLQGLGTHGVNIEEGVVFLSPQDLLKLASEVSGKSESEILIEGLSYMGQKLTTQFLSSASKQGTLGSADTRIIVAINELRKLISEGDYKPRIKNGKASLGDSVIAGRAMTSVATVRNFLSRKGSEISELLDVSDLIPE